MQHRQGRMGATGRSIPAKGFALDRHIPCLPHAWICTRCTFPACPFGSHANTAASSCHSAALRGCRVPHPQLSYIPACRQCIPQPGCIQKILLMSLGAQSCPQRKGSPRDPACIPFPMGSETLLEGPGPKGSQRKRKKMGQIYGMPPHSALGRDPHVLVPLTWYMHILGLIPLAR